MAIRRGFVRSGVLFLLILSFTATPLPSYAQEVSQASEPAASTAQGPASSSPSPSPDRNVTFRQLPKSFLHDQKEIWLFPVEIAKGHYLLPTALVVGGTAGLVAADPSVMPHFRQTTNFHGFNRALSSSVTGGLIAAVPIGFYAAGLISKNPYDQSTGLLMGEAIADDAVLMVIMKAITRRQRPTEIPINGNYSDTFFNSNRTGIGKGSSFPSGHAMMSFSVATIVAHRYRQHRWVPYVAYGLASAISFSRVTNGSHFPSEAFVGAALGFVIARYDVLRVH
jgi:hypothetical protein